MAKRGHGEGTAYFDEKRQRWEAQFPYRDEETGKPKRRKFIGKTRKEVLDKGKKWLQEVENGLLPNADKMTVWQWLDRWLADYVKPNVRIKSFEKCESCLRCYIKPTLGHIVINKLKDPDIQRVFNEMLISGGVKGIGVSTSTVRTTRRYLSMAFNKAVQIGIISKNIVKATDPPKLVKEEIKPLTKEQSDNLLRIAKTGEYVYLGLKQRQKPSPSSEYKKSLAYTVVLLALSTGMRLGEVFGLKWSDIDFTKNTINVQRALVYSNTKGMIFEDTKTKGSKRRISISDNVKKSLDKYRKEQLWFINIMGDKFNNENDLLFTNTIGKPTNTPNFLKRYFKKMLKQAEIDNSFTFHDLRHTHATLLLRQGVNIKVISERLGHSTITLTLDTYSHLMPDMQETAVKAIEQIFNI